MLKASLDVSKPIQNKLSWSEGFLTCGFVNC
jgi:hypothetical protein